MNEQRYIDPSIFSRKETTNTTEQEELKEKPNIIDIINLRQIFNEGKENEYRLFDNFNLSIPDFENSGQFISIMGASGCGKTCLLRAISGLTTIPGEIKIYGKSIKDYGNIPMVFQQYSSYDWFTVEFNVALPYIKRGIKKKEAIEKAREILKLVDLYDHKDKYAKAPELSGGQLQRVSIARCIATESQIILLDEATGALDIKMKREVQNILLKIFYESKYDPTIINVTHSIEEAVYLSNRIIILKAKPCTIHKVVDIDFGNERRGTWLLETEDYQRKVKEITEILNEIC